MEKTQIMYDYKTKVIENLISYKIGQVNATFSQNEFIFNY